MPTNTPNLNLAKPLVTEDYSVAVANANNDILDAQVANKAPIANPTFTGTQTLPNIVTNGIKFPATQVPSSDPNTLDDYEEGTWTPVLVAQNGVLASYTSSGKYTKIGNLVKISLTCQITNKGTGTGQLAIQGLPFAVVNAYALVVGGEPANSGMLWIGTLYGIEILSITKYDSTAVMINDGNMLVSDFVYNT